MRPLRRLLAAFVPLFFLGTAPVAAQSLEGVLMPGKVIEGHAKFEGDCRNCHVLLDKAAQDRLCLDCHKDVAQDVTGKRGHHGRIRIDGCRNCHTEHKGRGARIAPLNEMGFDHALTDYLLKGKHISVECRSCHKAGAKFRAAPGKCNDCHRQDDKHKGTLGTACADCHLERSWKETTFDHAKTRFPLGGKHSRVECKACHKTPVFKEAPMTCIGCHKADDRHKARYGEKCETCHVDRSWKEITFDHDTATDYALRGKHRQVKCDTCHAGLLYRDKLQSQCIACHRKDDKHKGTLGSACGDCHVERNWKETRFDHEKTRFPLLGKHGSVECKACHQGNVFKETPMTCIACHKKDDKHKNTLGEKCAQCHVERSWKETRFDHAATRFPLAGKHANVKCADCHTTPDPKATPQACVSCHRKDDRHKGTQSDQCDRCHVAQSWKSVRFDHDRDTRYPLRGKHRTATCESCHGKPAQAAQPAKLGSDCNGCHAKDDVHKAQQGSRCEQCHRESDWKTTTFDHARSRFPLTGGHLKVECKSCHTTAQFKDAKRECMSCHGKQDVHKRRLGTQCETCHNARSWKTWDFNHDRRTRFPLDGAHLKVQCYGCHSRPVDAKATLPSECVACHAADDVHEGGFGRQCERCHVSSTFKSIRQRMGSSGDSLSRDLPAIRRTETALAAALWER